MGLVKYDAIPSRAHDELAVIFNWYITAVPLPTIVGLSVVQGSNVTRNDTWTSGSASQVWSVHPAFNFRCTEK